MVKSFMGSELPWFTDATQNLVELLSALFIDLEC